MTPCTPRKENYILQTQEPLIHTPCRISTLFAAVFPVSLSVSQDFARIAAVKRPPFLLLENVPGLLSHDKGRTFATILGTLDELGYDVAWQILNSKDFGVPQSRKRVYIVGYLRERCAGEILSFTNANAASLIQLLGGTEGNRVYSDEGVGITLTSGAGGFGGKTGLYDVALPIKVDTKSGFQLAHPGDSIDLAFALTDEARQSLNDAVLGAYREALEESEDELPDEDESPAQSM